MKEVTGKTSWKCPKCYAYNYFENQTIGAGGLPDPMPVKIECESCYETFTPMINVN